MSSTAITSPESLLRCLAADAEARADVSPGDARSSGDSDGGVEVAMRSDQGELRSGDLFQQVQALVFGDVHTVKDTLTHRTCQGELDAIHSGRSGS